MSVVLFFVALAALGCAAFALMGFPTLDLAVVLLAVVVFVERLKIEEGR